MAPERLRCDALGSELFGIHLLSLLLTLITLGIYRFWWKTRARRYMLSHMYYKGDGFEYTGTGLELFVGFVIVFFAVALPFGGAYWFGLWLLQHGDITPGVIVLIAVYLTLMVLVGAAIYRAYKYRLSRTQWRGIRGGLSGSSFGYSIRFILLSLLQTITLGFATPYVSVKLYRYMLNNVWFGSGRLHFDTDWKPLFKAYLGPGLVLAFGFICVLIGYYDAIAGQIALQKAMEIGDQQSQALAVLRITDGSMAIGGGMIIVVIGLIASFWYAAALYRTILAGCEFEGVRFSGKLEGGRYAKFNLLNILLLVITFGLAFAWVQVRWLRLIAEVVHIHGDPDFERIGQSTADMPKFGEGLAEAFL